MAASSTENETPKALAPKAKPKSAKKASVMKKKGGKKPAKKAAGGGGASSKSDEIRRVATFMHGRGEKPRPSLIVKELKQNGIDVAPAQVSLLLKKMGFRPLRKRKGGKRAAVARAATTKPAASSTAVSLEDLLAAKKASATLGGTSKAIAALQALKKFED